jgi:nitroimidazol reductase NimA-like FMN-containing flavoprotein (pyridoxamine 5'-phosphate oxidase superfamily)
LAPAEIAIMNRTKHAGDHIARVLSPKSKWSDETVVQFLGETRLPMRISSINARGYPQITSLWFVFREDRFFCCTQPQSLVCKQIRANARVGFEVAVNEPPYFGISGQGDARVVTGDAAELLDALTDRYLEGRDPELKAWLLSRSATEAIIEIAPGRITSWDFRKRMTAASSAP